MNKVLYVFPDTNLFIQCQALEVLDWSLWSEFSEVQLIVSRPVQREIDNQKYRGNDRVGRRARKAYQQFRHILESDQGHIVVRETDPRVKLFLAEPGKPAAELMDVLDYTNADDELVGYTWEYRKQYESREVRLLTHDSGPMMTAKAIDLPFTPIPESWLLQPEPNEVERKVRQLNERISQLQAGPKFKIAFVDRHENEIQKITASLLMPLPLSTIEIDELTLTLKRLFPQNSLFYSNLRLNKKYHDRLYQEWIGRCREIFANLHKELQMKSQGITFSIVAANTGVSPARDVLVEISTKGKFLIHPLRETNELESDKWTVSLPQPPKPMDSPRYNWPSSASLMRLPELDGNYRRDANAFYYKPTYPDSPVESYVLECKQWRHGLDREYFDSEIFIEHIVDEIGGKIECTIHADNLPTPVKAHVPVHIEVEGLNLVECANSLITDLKN